MKRSTAKARDRVISSVDVLLELVVDRYEKARRGRALLLIGGCSRAGKSHLASRVCEGLGKRGIACVTARLDSWLLGVAERASDSNVMERYDCATIVRDVIELLEGNPVSPPTYDARTRQRLEGVRSPELKLEKGILIVDGVVALAIEELRCKALCNIYVDVRDEARRERLDAFYIDFKKMSAEAAKTILDQREREEVPFAKATSKWADIVFDENICNRRV